MEKYETTNNGVFVVVGPPCNAEQITELLNVTGTNEWKPEKDSENETPPIQIAMNVGINHLQNVIKNL